MKYFFTIITLLSLFQISGQQVAPYYSNFDNSNDTIGWHHYALSGNDDWVLGQPQKQYFISAYTQPNCWITNLVSNYNINSDRCLESPFFNFNSLPNNYVLSFIHKRNDNYIYNQLRMEYRFGSNGAWQIFNNTNSPSLNWQGNYGFSTNQLSFEKSCINLNFLQFNDSVQFRYRYITSSGIGDGWLIDDFSIAPENSNISAILSGDIYYTSSFCSTINVPVSFSFNNQYNQFIQLTTNFFLSSDSLLDLNDVPISTFSVNTDNSYSWTQQITFPSNINSGKYYIVYKHDANNILSESDENDNVGYVILNCDSVYTLPYFADFEIDTLDWKAYPQVSGQATVWKLGSGFLPHADGTHSGKKSWHTSDKVFFNNSTCGPWCNTQYVESPYFNLTNSVNHVIMNFWYKNHATFPNTIIEYSVDCENSWHILYSLKNTKNNNWEFLNLNLDSLRIYNSAKFRFNFSNSVEGMIFDDFYLGSPQPNLSIENGNKERRFTSTTNISDSLKYNLTNSGLIGCTSTTTKFYWSNDTILDLGDILLNSKQEYNILDTSSLITYFTYTKPNLLPGKYYILYQLDALNSCIELNENDNYGYFTIFQENSNFIPYSNDFETTISEWRHDATIGKDEWKWTTPNKPNLNNAFSGTKAWITNDTGQISSFSRMHLYSPIFNLTTSTHPVLEFDMKLLCLNSGQINMSYSIDGGASWIILDTLNSSYSRWYYPLVYDPSSGTDKIYVVPNQTNALFEENEITFASFSQYNGRDAERTTKYILDITNLKSNPQIQFRFNVSPKTYYLSENIQGAIIDNFTIKEKQIDLIVKKNKSLMISSNSNKIKFFINIKNQGNYISNPCISKFFLSSDTILDATDYLLGNSNISSIKPDYFFYLNTSFPFSNTPPNILSNYKYLIYNLDYTNTNIETNENNNIGYWPLSLDSIHTYPYYNNFTDSTINGWHHYSEDFWQHNILNYRIRNMLAPSEYVYQTLLQSGQFFTEPVQTVNPNPPLYNLESPAFDFSSVNNILMSFKLLCIGNGQNGLYGDGGNMYFSSDGGNNWTILDNQYGSSSNWYNYNNLGRLNNEPGWANYTTTLTTSTYDISFLKGKKHIVFKYRYRSDFLPYSQGNVYGFRLDFFKINALTTDYKADNWNSLILSSPSQTTILVNYSISNTGQSSGGNTKTNFYWSTDSIFDSQDVLIQSINENSIAAGNTYFSSINITPPLTISKNIYYLFYLVDADSAVVETNEQNNLGLFKINFQTLSNQEINDDSITFFVNENILYISSQIYLSSFFNIEIINALGQKVFKTEIKLSQDLTQIKLPEEISSGNYLISIQNNNYKRLLKVVIMN